MTITITSDSFLLLAAGYVDITHYRAHFGEGLGTIHINCLDCSGTEYRLVECPSLTEPWFHNEDWSVTCNNGKEFVNQLL